jgi:A/G-specific adenine glycosylase
MSSDRLIAWFRRARRELPWRVEPRDPYRVLVSELMLQQTQVERVVPRYEAFVERYPDLETLATADEEHVLEAWSGLGYYRRARLLHRLAREVTADGGQLPRSASELERLPGIGPYTAAALASLAFGEAAPVLDGNVLRVASRVLALEGDPRTASGRRRILSWVATLMRDRPPGEVNEALMELGSTVCRTTAPACDRCPLAAACAARMEGDPEAYPPARRTRIAEDHRWVAACVIDREGRWLLRRVADGPILRGLWLPPFGDLANGTAAVEQARRMAGIPTGGAAVAATVDHGITHRRIRVVPVRLELGGTPAASPDERWWAPGTPPPATSSLLAKLVEAVVAPRLPLIDDAE